MTAAIAATDSEEFIRPNRLKNAWEDVLANPVIDALIDPFKKDNRLQTAGLIAGGAAGGLLAQGILAFTAAGTVFPPALLVLAVAGIGAVMARAAAATYKNQKNYTLNMDSGLDEDGDQAKDNDQEKRSGLSGGLKEYSSELFSKTSLRTLMVTASGAAAFTIMAPFMMSAGLGAVAAVGLSMCIAGAASAMGSLALDYGHATLNALMGKDVNWGKVHKQAWHNAFRTSMATLSVGTLVGGAVGAVDAGADAASDAYNGESLNTSPTDVNPELGTQVDNAFEQEAAANDSSPQADQDQNNENDLKNQNDDENKFKTKSGRGARTFMPGL